MIKEKEFHFVGYFMIEEKEFHFIDYLVLLVYYYIKLAKLA